MTGMVERIARAIEASLAITGPDHPTLGIWAAHAALVAMREPTPEMLESCGNGECRKWAEGAWGNMIDAALSPQV